MFCAGVLPADTSLTMSGVKDVRQLDMLIRVHVVLAQIVGSAAQCYNDVCLTAYGYVLQLWKVSLRLSVHRNEGNVLFYGYMASDIS